MGLKDQVMIRMIEECVAPLKNLLSTVNSKIQSLEDFKEKIVTKIDRNSTDEQIPSAKSVFDFVGDKMNITVVENPNLWQLTPGWYYVHSGFYYGTNQYKAITDGVLFVAGNEEWAYFIITKTAKYSGDLSSDGETVTGTCNIEVITTSLDENSTDEEYPTAKTVFDALLNLKSDFLVQSLSGTVELSTLKQGVFYVLTEGTTLNLLNGESLLVEVSGYIFINEIYYNDDEIEAVSFSYFGLPFGSSSAGVVMSDYEETTVSEYVSKGVLEQVLKEYEEACTDIFQLNENLTQTIDENSTDKQYPSAKAVYDLGLANSNSSGSGTEQVQSDYSENDKTSMAYIKNRPFYEEEEKTTTEIFYSSTEGDNAATYVYDDDSTRLICAPLSTITGLENNFVEGGTLNATLSSKMSNTKSTTLTKSSTIKKYSDEVFYAGSWYWFEEDGSYSKDEDFLIVYNISTGDISIYLAVAQTSGSTLATGSGQSVQLESIVTTGGLHQIHEKYIPDIVTNATKTYVAEKISIASLSEEGINKIISGRIEQTIDEGSTAYNVPSAKATYNLFRKYYGKIPVYFSDENTIDFSSLESGVYEIFNATSDSETLTVSFGANYAFDCTYYDITLVHYNVDYNSDEASPYNYFWGVAIINIRDAFSEDTYTDGYDALTPMILNYSFSKRDSVWKVRKIMDDDSMKNYVDEQINLLKAELQGTTE